MNHVPHDDDWFNHPLISTHEFKSHRPCGHYIATQWVRGASTFESPEEAILPKPPTISGSVNSSTSTLPHFKEPLESHITPNHPMNDPLNHSYVLHQQPSPLNIVIVKPQCRLGEHQFIIFKSNLWYGETMHGNP